MKPPRVKPKATIQAPGKRVGGALYLHVSAIGDATKGVRFLVDAAKSAVGDHAWNVAKVLGTVVSLLLYEDFEDAAFPALLSSARVDASVGGAVVMIDYSGRANPPILHRKETLLLLSDPRRPAFAALTRLAEELGLFVDPERIGTRKIWMARVDAAGFVIRGAKMVPKEAKVETIARHRTAIGRRELSQPMQLMVGNGVVNSGMSVFDYGCGQGDDVAALSANGFEAFGWDPHHAVDGPRREADVVNLGFVLNVVEDRHEREETLKAAWSFARGALCVSTMVAGKVSLAGLRPYGDGHVTSRGTFQKYFGQQELRDLIHGVLGEAPIALGTGIFVVFRDKEMEQELLFRRRARSVVRHSGMRPPARVRSGVLKEVRPALTERMRPELEALWAAMLGRGRILDGDEFPAGTRETFEASRLSPARATSFCVSDLFSQDDLLAAAAERREDYLVHFALTLFPGAPRYSSLPKSIQRDVRVFLGNHATAMDLATELLFSAGRPEVIQEAVDAAIKGCLGAMRGDATFRFQVSVMNRLPAVLRVLVGCAALLRGGVEGADYVDIKLAVRRVNFITCADASARLPLVTERTRVDLKRLRASVDKPDGLVIYLKSRFMAEDDPERDGQTEFDERLLLSGIVLEDGRGPRYGELQDILRQKRAAREAAETS